MAKQLPSLPAKVSTKDHELQVMSRMADLYALLQPAARHRVHHYMGERLDSLPVLAGVGDSEPEAPVLPFHNRERENEDAAEAAS
jgi:hypothetical protein